MADVLEEFHRPAANYSAVGNESVQVDYRYPCIQTKLELQGDTMEVSYIYSDKVLAAQNRRIRTAEIDDYFNPKQGFIDLSYLGIKKVNCDCVSA